jgi:peptidoglycan hydrolase-like protein with peptidoglycan-binding domain
VAEPAAHRLPRRLPRRRWLALAAVALATAAVLAVVLIGAGSPKRAGADTGVPPGDTTAAVTRRTLSESSTVDGTLGYGSKLELYDRVSGTFTWLPAVGAVIGRGGTLWKIDDHPVALMYGSVPAYRALKRGVGDGPDVRELNDNLIALGYDPYGAISDVEAFGEATAAAVKRWQQAEGLAQTGEVELGRVVFAPSARRVTELHVALGQDPPGAEGAPATTTPATTPTTTSPTTTTPTSPTTTPTKTSPAPAPAAHEPKSSAPKSKAPASHEPKSSKPSQRPSSHTPAKKPASHAPSGGQPSQPSKSPSKESPRSSDGATPSGGGTAAGELTLSTTSTQQLVQLKVKAEQQQLAHVGERVPVTLPGGSVVHGRITEVGTVASEAKGSPGEEKGNSGQSGESGENATVTVTVALDHPVAHLDQAPVSVALVRNVSHDVLTVPATALIATAGGGYAVDALDGGRRVTVAVTPGMFADGYVAIEGAGVHEGLTVIEAQ